MKKLLFGLALILAGLGSFALACPVQAAVNVYRLYNPNTGEHFYSSSTTERAQLIALGWSNEGIGWVAPNQGQPVYRLYNPNAKGGDHYYTTRLYEKDQLVKAGWHFDGVFWKSGGSIPVYVAYNPNAQSGAHNFTTNLTEQNQLLRAGWRYSQIAWRAQGMGKGLSSAEKLTNRLNQIQQIFNQAPDLMSAEYYDLQTNRFVGKNATAYETSASTYKLYTARFIIHLIDSGALSWSSPCPTGGNIRAGFYDMIHNSGNDFPIWVSQRYGANTINQWLITQGYQPIYHNLGYELTTAKDLTTALKYIWQHQSNPNIAFLIGLMQGQIFRDGIPSGTGEITADKVGFLWDVRNDAGIVYNKTPYLLVLMTNHQANFNLIHNLAQKVERAVNASR